MKQYERYIVRSMVISTVIVTLSLTSIVWLMQALRLVDFIVNQGIPLLVFLQLAALLLPSIIMLVLPAAMGITAIYYYHKLKSESELTALLTSGLSRLQIARPALFTAAGFTAFGYLISLYILPVSYGAFKELQFYLRNHYISVLLQEGVFSTPVDGLMVYVRERDADGNLKGLLVHDRRDPSASITMMAETAKLSKTNEGPRFLLTNGNRQELRNDALSYLEFDSYDFDMSIYSRGMADRKADSEEKSVIELLKSSGPTATKDRADAHQRMIWPGYGLSFTAMVLALILTGEFNRRQRWKRNAAAASLMAGLLFLAVALKNVMASNTLIIPLAYLAMLLPAIFGFIVLAKWPLTKTSTANSL